MTLLDCIKHTDLTTLTIPSNMTYGTAIFKRGAVEIIDQNDTQVTAWAGGLTGKVVDGGGSRRRVELKVEGARLIWHCTGNPKDHDIFCKHCVAVALYLSSP